LQFLELFHPCLPQFQEDSSSDPLLKAIMGGGMRAEVGGVQGGPLTAGAQYIEDGVGTAPVGRAWLAPAKPVGVLVLGE